MRRLFATMLFLGMATIAHGQVSLNGQTPCGQRGNVYVNESTTEVVRIQVVNSCTGNAVINVNNPGFPPKTKTYGISANHSLAIRVSLDAGGTIEVQSAGTGTGGSTTCFYYLRLP